MFDRVRCAGRARGGGAARGALVYCVQRASLATHACESGRRSSVAPGMLEDARVWLVSRIALPLAEPTPPLSFTASDEQAAID